jgi:hypothetical protein
MISLKSSFQCSQWFAISFYLTPHQLVKLLLNCDDQSRCNFMRVKTQIMKNIVKLIPMYINQNSNIELIFEHLTNDGYFPKHLDGYNNTQFGYLKNGQWFEWNLISISEIRRHWHNILQNLKTNVKDEIWLELQKLILMFPGDKVVCDSCSWLIPLNSMHSDFICCYCVDSCKMENQKNVIRV